MRFRPLFSTLVVLVCLNQADAQPIPGAIHPDLNTLPRPPSRVPIYYLPTPPAPGAEIDPVPALLMPNWNPPPGLSEYVGELFYPVVGSRLAEMELSRQQRSRINAYIKKRGVLVATLRHYLAGEKVLPPDHSEEVNHLASEGDWLRSELIDKEFDWDTHRSWRVGPTEGEKDELLVRIREFHLLRANVFYFDVLTVDQRWLLWDYVLRLEEVGPGGTTQPSSVRPGGLVRFLPEGSRIRLPLKVTNELVEDLNAFVEAKESIQRDIAETVIRLDNADRAERETGFTELVRRQKAQISDLEQQAETIRVRLASLPDQRPFILPQHLADHARTYRQNRDEMQIELAATLRAARAEILEYQPGSESMMWLADFEFGQVVPVTSAAPGMNLAIVAVETDAQRDRAERAQARLNKSLQEHMRESAERQDALENERREWVNAALHTFAPGTSDNQSESRELTTKILALFAMDEIAGRMDRYQSYLAATSRPGLTPSQRRLLFGEALRELSLPLTPGVRRPFNQMISP